MRGASSGSVDSMPAGSSSWTASSAGGRLRGARLRPAPDGVRRRPARSCSSLIGCGYAIFMAARTSSIVARATSRARSRALVQDVPHRVGARRELRPPGVDPLQALQQVLDEPALAVEAADARRCGSPAAAHSWVSSGEKALCRSNTGQMSGLPGSVRRLRAGSVTIGLIFCAHDLGRVLQEDGVAVGLRHLAAVGARARAAPR